MTLYQKPVLSTVRLLEYGVIIGITVVFSVFAALGIDRRETEIQVSVDEQTAETMTAILRQYLETYEPEGAITAPEIRWIINQTQPFDFNTLQSDRAFWYHIDSQTIVVRVGYEYYDLAPFADSKHAGPQLEELIAGYLLLDPGSTHLSSTLNRLRNLSDSKDFTEIATFLDIYGLGEHARNFAPNRTLFIHNFGCLSTAQNPLAETNVIFAEDIIMLPANALATVGHLLPDQLRLPASLQSIEKHALHTLPNTTKLLHDDVTRLLIEADAFTPSHTLNELFLTRQGTAFIGHVQISFSFSGTQTEFFHYQNGTLVRLGFLERREKDWYAYYDADDILVGYHDGQNHFDSQGELLANGIELTRLIQLITAFQMAHRREDIIRQNLSWRITTESTQLAPEVRTIKKQYHMKAGKQYVTLMMFDRHQQLTARGTAQLPDTWFDLESIVPKLSNTDEKPITSN